MPASRSRIVRATQGEDGRQASRMVLLAPVLGPAAVVRDQAAGAAPTWAYEQLLVIVSLVGVGVGLPVAFAGYAKARWPEALGGPLDAGEPAGHTRRLQLPLGRIVAVGCVLLGATKLFWALGGTVGIDPGRLAGRDLWWQLFTLSMGGWSLAGAWAILVLTTRRGFKWFLFPMIVGWVASGMLFAYNLFLSLRADAQASPEHPVARVLATQAGIVLGLVMALGILLVVHDRRRALRGEATDAG
jgi:hypothetical protein